VAGVADFDLFSDRDNAFDSANSALGLKFLGVAPHVASQNDNAVLDRYADVSRIDAWSISDVLIVGPRYYCPAFAPPLGMPTPACFSKRSFLTSAASFSV
jgi:hypothetical protein